MRRLLHDYLGSTLRRRLGLMVSAIRKRPAVVFGGIALLAVLGLVLQNRIHIFTLDVITEIIAFTTTDPVLTAWDLGATSELLDLGAEDDPFAENATGRELEPHAQLIIHEGTQVALQRHGTGVIRVQLTRDGGNSTGRIQEFDTTSQLGTTSQLSDRVVLLVEPAGTPMLFPFRGKLTVGYDVAAGVDSVLQSGTVSVVERQLISDTHYTANTESLDAGDRVQLVVQLVEDWKRLEVLATVSGFVRAEPAASQAYSEPVNALNLVAHGQADFVQVDRLGSTGYKIRATRWARFVHDPVLAAATAIVALFALLMEFGSKCSDFISAYRRKDDADKGQQQAGGLVGDADENA